MKPVEVSFTPIDNPQLTNLYNVLNKNLHQIETALNITIAHHNEHFALTSKPDQTHLTTQTLEQFYTKTKRNLSIEDVQLKLIEITHIKPSTPTKNTPQLKTQHHDLHNHTPHQIQYLKQIQNHNITFSISPASTDKTYLTIAYAINALEHDHVKRIVLIHPTIEANKRLDFLPDDITQKINPYLQPLYNALYDLLDFDQITKLFEHSAIKITPLAFMHSHTLNHSFVILDEAQNTTPKQMKMFLTRIDFGNKAIITNNITQTDLPHDHKSELIEARAVLKRVHDLAFTHFQSNNIIHHPLIQHIVNTYERHSKTQAEPDA